MNERIEILMNVMTILLTLIWKCLKFSSIFFYRRLKSDELLIVHISNQDLIQIQFSSEILKDIDSWLAWIHCH